MNWWELLIDAFAIAGIVYTIIFVIKQCFFSNDNALSYGHINSALYDSNQNITSVIKATGNIEEVVRAILSKVELNRELEQKSFEINLKDNGRIQNVCDNILGMLNNSLIPMISENMRLNNLVNELESKNRELTADVKELIQASKGTLYEE